MQKSRLQHRKAVTLDTEMWPWDNSRVDKLEKDVDGIRGDVTEIKENVNKLIRRTCATPERRRAEACLD